MGSPANRWLSVSVSSAVGTTAVSRAAISDREIARFRRRARTWKSDGLARGNRRRSRGREVALVLGGHGTLLVGGGPGAPPPLSNRVLYCTGAIAMPVDDRELR